MCILANIYLQDLGWGLQHSFILVAFSGGSVLCIMAFVYLFQSLVCQMKFREAILIDTYFPCDGVSNAWIFLFS